MIDKTLVLLRLGATATVLLLSGVSWGQASLDKINRQALIIGNDSYPSIPLKNATNDARGIGEKLNALGFVTEVALNVNQAGLDLAVERFILRLNPGDTGLFYFAGHGFQVDGDNYMAPIDFAATNPTDAKYAAYSVSRVLEKMNSHRTKMNMIILDACRNNPFVFSRSIRGGWAPMDGGTGTFIAFATSPGSTASDDPNGRNGLFTKNLLAEMTTPGLSLDELFSRVRRRVASESSGAQIPWTASSIISDFDFAEQKNKTEMFSQNTGRSVGENTLPLTTATALSVEARAQLNRSVAEVSAAVYQNPKDAAALVVRARGQIRLGEFSAALDGLSQAISARRDYAEAYRLRGRVYLLLKQPSPAIDDLGHCVEADPSDPAALYYRSIAYFQAGQYELAIKDATEMIRQAPSLGEGFMSRASIFLAQGRMEDALRDCSQAIGLNPELVSCFAVRGRALQALGRPKEARQEFSRASLNTRRMALDLGSPSTIKH